MKRRLFLLALPVVLGLLASADFALSYRSAKPAVGPLEVGQTAPANQFAPERVASADESFEVAVLVDGHPLYEYAAGGRRYVEARQGAEYELRIHNPLPVRVAVALAVDGLNTIDARHTTAWEAHKWVIGPYQTIDVGGWQMSSERARHFYFTTERDSYAAKLGQTANLGVISAVFFRERRPAVVTITPAQPRERSQAGQGGQARRDTSGASEAPVQGAPRGDVELGSTRNRSEVQPPPDDESAATGIGRSVQNEVRWIRMDLERQPAAEVTIRYEYRAGLVKLGIIPRDNPRTDVLDRRERARGFQPRFCPEP